MRVRRLIRVAGHLASSGAGTARHTLRRSIDGDRWTRTSPHRILWVAPERVIATTAERIGEDARGQVIDGDWDLTALPLEGLSLWRGLEQRLREGRPWADTELAPGRHTPEAPNVGRRSIDLSADAMYERLAGLDALAASLLRDGWLPHHDVGATFRREMAVAVARDGRLIRDSGGLHRLVMARILGLGRIPCRILVEHADYRGDAIR